MPDIDYDALATQARGQSAGGAIDYDALAAKARDSAEHPSALSRFATSAVAAVNPIPAIKEWANRPAERQKAASAVGDIKTLKAQGVTEEDPRMQSATERGMNAQIGTPAASTSLPIGTEGGFRAAEQARQGDVAGAAGTLTGAYGVPAAISGVARAMKGAAPRLQESAVESYSDALNPTTNKNKKITPDVARGAIERGVMGTRKSLQQQTAGNLRESGGQLQRAVANVEQANPPVSVSVSPIIARLDELKAKSITNGVVTNPNAVAAIEQYRKMLTDLAENDAAGSPTDVSYASLRKARQDLDSQIGSGHIVTSDQAPRQLIIKRTADAIRHELAEAQPDVAKIDAEYSFWKNLGRVNDATAMRKTGQAPSLLGTIAATGAGAFGFTHGGGLATGAGAAALAAATMYGLHKLVRSPVWQTTSAVVKSRLANALAAGNTATADKIIGSIAIGKMASPESIPQFARGGIVVPQPKKRRRWYAPQLPKVKAGGPPPFPKV